MLDIKKYSNGKFFDSVNRKYLKKDRIKEYIKKGEQLKFTLTTTGEDITEEVMAQFSKKSSSLNLSGFITKDLKAWIIDTIDHRINQVLDVMNLPSKDQVAKLNEDLKKIDEKIEALESLSQKEASTDDRTVGGRLSVKSEAEASEASNPIPVSFESLLSVTADKQSTTEQAEQAAGKHDVTQSVEEQSAKAAKDSRGTKADTPSSAKTVKNAVKKKGITTNKKVIGTKSEKTATKKKTTATKKKAAAASNKK